MTFERAFNEAVQKLEALAEATEQEYVFETALEYAKRAKSIALEAKSDGAPFGRYYSPCIELLHDINSFLGVQRA